MASVYDVYGLRSRELGDQLDQLAAALDVRWEERHSEYRGVYHHAPVGDGEFLVQSNDLRDESGSYLQLPNFPEHRFLLFVNEHDSPDDVRRRLGGLPQWEFLRRRTLD
ncbi:hypothetical protein [Micromonospora siamensis]|uniref:Uncharacterized protein n=1 Tax=Micromonospora siamensis TaxID=299152 RepID=A0A1C5JV83_9ACTN|nr:hypothetical protein [Micromonospora siamensis]SCG74494.1 hypothetical protein GA0074704_5049 [Micromonospora siamensis]